MRPLFCASAAVLLCACVSRPARPIALENAAQRHTRYIGAEVQGYPAGVIPGVHAQFELTETDVLTLRAAANITDRHDWGEQDDEEGDGGGVGIGFRRYLSGLRTGWLWGARLDVWALEIDWENDSGPADEREGTTDVIVAQPTLEAGYGFDLGGDWWLDLTVGFGFEINVDTDGEDVGEGPIFLAGFTLLRGF